MFWSPVSRIVPKNVKGGPLGVFEHPLFCKIETNEGGPFADIKKSANRRLTKPKRTCTKGWDSNPHPSAWQTSKKPN